MSARGFDFEGKAAMLLWIQWMGISLRGDITTQNWVEISLSIYLWGENIFKMISTICCNMNLQPPWPSG